MRHTPVTLRRALPSDMDALMRLREEVFVREQGVPPELERDDHDASAVHLVAESGGTVVGCCRLLGHGATVHLGRMAVAATARGTGVGARLLAFAHRVAGEEGASEVALSAQVSARGFYARAGYLVEGDEFIEAGIVHVAMRRAV